jgi:Zn-dependent alcohol dehydrogenase
VRATAAVTESTGARFQLRELELGALRDDEVLVQVARGIVEGDSVPGLFLPQLIKLWEQGRFPVERLMTFYDFDQIDEAAHDAESGRPIKAVLRMA